MHAVLVTTKTGDWQRLGRYVRERRELLRLTQQDVTSRGGPSIATIRNIEAASRDSYRGLTYSQLENALGWEHGSVDEILRGGEPALTQATTPDRPAGPPQPAPRAHRATLGDVLVERGLARPDQLGLSDQIEDDPLVKEILEATEFDDDFKNRWLLAYAQMRRQIFEDVRQQKKKPRE
ncbi:hypothetical protein SAMN05660976_05280 [Nonomuraea pusilla]|uniref:Helix-turn-helix domain-containing protein n=1 Tax=Nonomuraea pusilla TaxID=46177 RepID=A0A1H7YXC0_9ACTN|nr:hypothetical protein SAMN05660976_05280 [Nonomuraea pusilla]